MRKTMHQDVNIEPSGERAAAMPYIIGFALSLCFTIIPYNLVTGHLEKGTRLLGVILGIGVIQMIIQVVFFLHLGRERKPRWQLYFFGGTVFGILTVVGGSIFIMAHLHGNMSPVDTVASISQDEGIAQVEGQKTGACQTVHKEHAVVIKSGVTVPDHTDAHVCDTLVFTTEDPVQRTIVFGSHPTIAPYAGVEKLQISKDHGSMLILSQAGTYQFHDNLHPSVTGTFTVTE